MIKGNNNSGDIQALYYHTSIEFRNTQDIIRDLYNKVEEVKQTA